MIITKYIEKSRRNSVAGESSSGCNIEDLNRVKQQMTMEAITQGTAEYIMHHVMINFMLDGEMRFMQFDFTRESADTKKCFPVCGGLYSSTAADIYNDVAFYLLQNRLILRN